MKNQLSDNAYSFLDKTRKHVKILIEGIPVLAARVREFSPDFSVGSAELLERIPLTITDVEGMPVVTIAFSGPSGAGKSTVFNLLTGLKVPAGGAIRPMTHASLAASPLQVVDRLPFEQLFPGFTTVKLESMDELRNPESPKDRLFTAGYSPSFVCDDFWPCLIDVPDFNTTELKNWDKAEQMIKRADSVIFTVNCEAYKNLKTFEIMKKLLLLAGSVTYLLTKLDSDDCATSAREIRDDILTSAASDPEFQKTRADGSTLLRFLERTPFFYSPHERNMAVETIKPVAGGSSDFVSQVFGQRGLEILLNRQLQSIAAGIDCSEMVCREAIKIRRHARSVVKKVDSQLGQAAERITGEEFPISDFLTMIRSVLEESRPFILQQALKPFLFIASGLKSVITRSRTVLSRLSGKDIASSVKLRNDLEKARLHRQLERLIEHWRSNPENGSITTQQARKLIDGVMGKELPPVDSEWRETVTESLQEWRKGNRYLWLWLNVVNDLMLILGTGLVAADVLIAGGIGTIGLMTVIGGGSTTGAMLLSLFNNMGLGNQIVQAHYEWKKLRKQRYFNHLRENLAGPLFLDRLAEVEARLETSLIKECGKSCETLKEMIRYNEQA